MVNLTCLECGESFSAVLDEDGEAECPGCGRFSGVINSNPKEKKMAYDIHDIERNFKYHAPTEHQIAKYREIRADAKTLALRILDSCPTSREQSKALTGLEEVVMWANAAIARNE